MTTETDLVLGNLVIPAGAGRGISQTLKPIDNGDVRRTVNGDLLDLTRVENRKFESQISVTDMASPTLAGLWKGSTLQVSCIQPLYELVDPESTTHTVIRDPVVASIKGFDSSGNRVPLSSATGVGNRDLTFDSPVKHVQFRPILNMMILAINHNKDEYSTDESWTIDMEEV